MVAAPGRAVSVVQSGEGPLLALDHDKATTLPLDVSGPLEQAAALMVANARLHIELRDRARELEAARRRLVDSEALERRRLGAAASSRRRTPAAKPCARTLSAAEQVSTPAVVSELVVADWAARPERGRLRDGCRAGLYPSTLTADGLPAALRELADNAPVTVQTVIRRGRCRSTSASWCTSSAEALANVAKHCAQQQPWSCAHSTAAGCASPSSDDGVGGAAVWQASVWPACAAAPLGIRGHCGRPQPGGCWHAAGGGGPPRAAHQHSTRAPRHVSRPSPTGG